MYIWILYNNMDNMDILYIWIYIYIDIHTYGNPLQKENQRRPAYVLHLSTSSRSEDVDSQMHTMFPTVSPWKMGLSLGDPWIPPILMYHHFPCKFTVWPILRPSFCEAQNWEAVARLQQTQERDHQECKPGMPQGNDPIWPHGFMKVFAFEQNPDDAISIFTPICIYIVYIYACMHA